MVDALIVTAIKLEYDAVLEVDTGALPGSTWEKQMGPTGFEVAFRTFQAEGGGTLRVAVTRALEMGGVATTAMAAPLLLAYSPQCLAMCGVCAGRRDDVQLGDVIIADRLWTYDTGQLVVEKDEHGQERQRVRGDMFQYQLNARWKQAAESFEPPEDSPWLALRPRTYESQTEWLLERLLEGEDPRRHPDRAARCADYGRVIAELWKKGWVEDGKRVLTDVGRQHIERQLNLHPEGFPESKPFKAHLGPIGTGSKVVKDPDIFNKLSESMRKVLGLEMEASAIGALAHQQDIPYMVVMKGVMDFADPAKSDNFKHFAARASAECLLAFLRAHLRPAQSPPGHVRAADTRLDELLVPGTSERPRKPSPAALLNARFQYVDFLDSIRSTLLEELRTWCEGDEAVSVRLFHGPGGAGKTHLFIEWCKRLHARGWRAGFLDGALDPDDLKALVSASTARPTLAVIDYAESHQGLAALLQALARYRDTKGQGRFRLVLVAREPGDWWEDLQKRSSALQALLGNCLPTEVTPLALEGTAREDVFWHAARCLAGVLGHPPPERHPVSLDDSLFERVLYIHMAALAVVEGLPFRTETLMEGILDHEERFWGTWFDGNRPKGATDGERRLFQDQVRHVVTALKLKGGASDRQDARELLLRSCGEQDETLLLFLRDLYPTAREAAGIQGVSGLEPDLLGEAMALRTLRAEGRAAGAWLKRVFDGAEESAMRTAFEVLGRISADASREAEAWIEALLNDAVQARAVAALEAAKTVGQHTVSAALGRQLARALRCEGTLELATRLEAAGFPERAVSLHEAAVWVMSTLVRRLENVEREDVLVERARLLNSLSLHQSGIGRREAALASAQEAVGHYRTLVERHPEEFLPHLATSLSTLGAQQSHVGRREDALASAREAVGHYRMLVEKRPEVFLPYLARGLNNLGPLQSEVGRWEEALASTQEAVNHFRKLAERHPDAFLPDLAGGLLNLGNQQSEVGRREEALASAQEAVDHFRTLAEKHPEAFLQDLAMGLNNLGPRQSGVGRWEAALASAREAVSHYRTLAERYPEAFLPGLARSLNNLGLRHSEVGRREEALAPVQEAVGHYRTLTERNRDAFLPDLATSLNNLGRMQSEVGRREEALASAQEAVGHYRTLVERHPEAFLSYLARSLSNLGLWQSEVGRRGEALASAQEAVEHYRALVEKHPEAFLPGLAICLNILAPQQCEVGWREEALASVQEAVKHFRTLVEKHPEAFLPNLAMSLSNLGRVQSEMGRWEAALASAQEAVGHFRTLAERHPEAFLPSLAISLINLSLWQSEVGRLEEALAAAQEALDLIWPFFQAQPPAFESRTNAILQGVIHRSVEAGIPLTDPLKQRLAAFAEYLGNRSRE